MLIPSNEKVRSPFCELAPEVTWVFARLLQTARKNLHQFDLLGCGKKGTAIQEQSRPPPASAHMKNILGGVLAGSEAVSVAEAETYAAMPMATAVPVTVTMPLAVVNQCGEAMLPPPSLREAREQNGRTTAHVPDLCTPADASVLQSPYTHAIVSRPSQRRMQRGGRPRIYADETTAAAAKKEKQAKRRADAGAEGRRRHAFRERVRVLHRKDPAAAAELVASALAAADPAVHSCAVQSLSALRSSQVEEVLKDARWCDNDLDQWLAHVSSC